MNFLLLEIGRCLRFRVYNEGEIIFQQESPLDGSSPVYLILRGSVSLFQHGTQGLTEAPEAFIDRKIKELSFGSYQGAFEAGDIFGKEAIAAFKGKQSRKVTAITQSLTTVAALSQHDYQQARDVSIVQCNRADILHIVQIPSKQRTNAHLMSIVHFLSTYHCFATLPEEILIRLSQSIEYKHLPVGGIASRQHELETMCFIVLSGTLIGHVADSDSETFRKRPDKPAYAIPDFFEVDSFETKFGMSVFGLEKDAIYGDRFLGSSESIVVGATIRAKSKAQFAFLSHASYKHALMHYRQRHFAASLTRGTAMLLQAPKERKMQDVFDMISSLRYGKAGSFFNQFHDDVLESLLRSAQSRDVSGKIFLAQQGKTPSHLIVVLSGKATVNRKSPSKQRVASNTHMATEGSVINMVRA